jgi:hypothetical protein
MTSENFGRQRSGIIWYWQKEFAFFFGRICTPVEEKGLDGVQESILSTIGPAGLVRFSIYCNLIIK